MQGIMGRIFDPAKKAAGGYRYLVSVAVGVAVAFFFYGLARFFLWVFSLMTK